MVRLLVIFLCSVLVVNAQDKTGISGQLISQQKPVGHANIHMLKSADSSLSKIAVSDAEGRFHIASARPGKYFLRITAVGYAPYFSSPFDIIDNSTAINLGSISLEVKTTDLKAVTVVATRPLIEQKIDRTVVNVEASITNVGASALEVLEKSPGVNVDRDGNISLKGKDGVIVLIDGRQTHLSGPDLANLLRSMTSSQLDQIEIMTNPPAKFDAAGNSGVINIKTKKSKQFGYNGTLSLNYGQGRLPKANESFVMNYRKGKVNLFGNLTHSFRENFNELDIQRNFREKTTKELLSFFDQEARMRSSNSFYNARVGIDYSINKKTTVGAAISGFISNEDSRNNNVTIISDASNSTSNKTTATATSDRRWANHSINLNFRHQLDTSGTEISGEMDYIQYDATNQQRLINAYFNESNQPTEIPDTLLGQLPQNIKIYSGRVDYTRPLSNDSRLEFGVKTSIVRTDNDARYDSLLNNELVPDYGRSNHFIYEENINAAYVNYSRPVNKRINAQLGLRLENTNAKGRQLGNLTQQGSTFERNYTQLFPTAFLQYKLHKNHNLGLNYGRRIQRPNYQSLNPFIYFLDRYTYEQGNPNLQPQFSHNLELSHTFKNFLTTTLNYARTTDIIQDVLEQNEEKNETFVKKANIANQRQVGLSISANKQITKWWSGNLYLNVYNNHFKGVVNNTAISQGGTTFILNGSQQFKFPKGWSAEIGGFYRTSAFEGVFVALPMGVMNIGFGKQILKNNGSLRLNIRDVFYTQQFRASSKYSNVDVAFQNARDSRIVNLSFTYRFAKGKMNGNGPQKRKGSANDEQNRVGVGSGG